MSSNRQFFSQDEAERYQRMLIRVAEAETKTRAEYAELGRSLDRKVRTLQTRLIQLWRLVKKELVHGCKLFTRNAGPLILRLM